MTKLAVPPKGSRWHVQNGPELTHIKNGLFSRRPIVEFVPFNVGEERPIEVRILSVRADESRAGMHWFIEGQAYIFDDISRTGAVSFSVCIDYESRTRTGLICLV